jgi:hypothetical protein
MNKQKDNRCKKCNCETAHNYNGTDLCKYHYWIEFGKPKTARWKWVWKNYKYFNPVRVARWREQDDELNAMFEEMNK